ncbi:MAG: nickel insertion protein, partial [Patescibacteria group bacterium]
SFNVLKNELNKLRLNNFKLSIKKVRRNGIHATKVDVLIKNEKSSHRKYTDIVKLIEKSLLRKEVKQKVKDIFYKLA